jgi:hypothetical protein
MLHRSLTVAARTIADIERTSVTENTKGSDIVLRGLMLLALMIMLGVGSFAIFFRRPNPPPSPALDRPENLAAMLVQPAAGFPGTLTWMPLILFADELPSAPGWRVRYQAVRNLAFHGSLDVSWDVYADLLDEHRQFCNFRTRLPDGRVIVEEAAARQIIIGGLQDLATWHNKQDRTKLTTGPELLAVYRAVDKLAQSPIAELKSQAESTRTTFVRGVEIR